MYNPVFHKKDRTSSILIFSNNSVKLVTLKNCFLKTVKALHSIRMWLTVQVVWHVKHCGGGSCFNMKAWVNLVWPMSSQDITTFWDLNFVTFWDLNFIQWICCWFGLVWFVGFYGISTFVGYLTPNPFLCK